MTAAPPLAATREALGPALIRLRDEGLDLVVVDADLGKSTSARQYEERFPERFFTFGVAEQNMISAAAGMAAMGKTVFASTFAVFTEHAFDQLRMSVSQPSLDVKLVASHGGVSVGEDGASAQAVEDIAVMSSLVNFRVVVPADVVEATAVIEVAARTPGPFYIRTDRPKHAVIYTEGPRFQLGRADMLRDGRDVTLISYGLMVERTLEAAVLLAVDGIEARVLNMATIRPARHRRAHGRGGRHRRDRRGRGAPRALRPRGDVRPGARRPRARADGVRRRRRPLRRVRSVARDPRRDGADAGGDRRGRAARDRPQSGLEPERRVVARTAA